MSAGGGSKQSLVFLNVTNAGKEREKKGNEVGVVATLGKTKVSNAYLLWTSIGLDLDPNPGRGMQDNHRSWRM